MTNAVIREIKLDDNAVVAILIRKILTDFGVPKVGSVFADITLDNMYGAYAIPRACYYVLTLENTIIGCAGIAQLDNGEAHVCELQKMYFLESARGKGLGTQMIELCLEKARTFGYRQCYLETMPYMKAAQKLYTKNGFEFINAPMGNTGHHACPVWMLKDLD